VTDTPQTITVMLTECPSVHFAATKFDVRDDGRLQITEITGQEYRVCAEFAPGRWTGVYFAAAKAAPRPGLS
jgi:hypothetical protein